MFETKSRFGGKIICNIDIAFGKKRSDAFFEPFRKFLPIIGYEYGPFIAVVILITKTESR